MGYTMHEMNVLLFSKEDSVFGTEMNQSFDNEGGDTTTDGEGGPGTYTPGSTNTASLDW